MGLRCQGRDIQDDHTQCWLRLCWRPSVISYSCRDYILSILSIAQKSRSQMQNIWPGHGPAHDPLLPSFPSSRAVVQVCWPLPILQQGFLKSIYVKDVCSPMFILHKRHDSQIGCCCKVAAQSICLDEDGWEAMYANICTAFPLGWHALQHRGQSCHSRSYTGSMQRCCTKRL